MSYKPELLIIPYKLIEDKDLQPADKITYGVIYYFEKMKDGVCKASNKKIADFTQHTTGTVGNSLSKLNKMGYITIYYKDEEHKLREKIECNIVFSQKKASSNNDGFHEIMKGVSSNNDGGASSNNEQINKSNIMSKRDITETDVSATATKEESLSKQAKELLQYFHDEYKQRRDYSPVISWDKHNKIARPFVRDEGLEQMKEFVLLYFNNDGNNDYFKNNNWSIDVFLNGRTLNNLKAIQNGY